MTAPKRCHHSDMQPHKSVPGHPQQQGEQIPLQMNNSLNEKSDLRPKLSIVHIRLETDGEAANLSVQTVAPAQKENLRRCIYF